MPLLLTIPLPYIISLEVTVNVFFYYASRYQEVNLLEKVTLGLTWVLQERT